MTPAKPLERALTVDELKSLWVPTRRKLVSTVQGLRSIRGVSLKTPTSQGDKYPVMIWTEQRPVGNAPVQLVMMAGFTFSQS